VALDCFKTAVKLRPDRLIHHIELGRTYAQMGKTEEARKALNKGLAMPNTEKDDPESKRRGREALAKL
jgi:predicted Zn-dependent protease